MTDTTAVTGTLNIEGATVEIGPIMCPAGLWDRDWTLTVTNTADRIHVNLAVKD